MSVIFEALNKVRQSEKEPFDQEANDSPPANVYTIRGLLFSPQGILGIAILVLLFGGMVYLGASYLGDMAGRKKGNIRQTPKDATAYIPPEDSHDTSGKIPPATPTVPPPPQQANYQKVQPGVLYLPPKAAPTGEKAKGPLVVLTERGASSTSAPIIEGGEQRSFVQQSPFREPGPLKEAHIEKELDFDGPFTEGKSPQPNSRTQSKKENSIAGDTKTKPKPASSEHTTQGPVIFSKRSAQQASMLFGDQKQQVQEISVTESTLKTAQISQVVSRLQVAMALGDEQKVDNLMLGLEELKGKGDPFVLKLKAYWLMKKGRYEDAGRLLMKVIERDPKDLEAGINMAIVEIKKGELEKARQRLGNLREIYPVNSKIPELLRKING